jgi:hypothetical protein
MQQFYKFWQQTGKRVLVGDGNPHAPWWVVSDGVSQEDLDTGAYLSAGTRVGGLFRAMLDQARVTPDSIFLTSIYPVPDARDILTASSQFHEFIDRYRPKRILAMGATALRALVAKEGIEEWRGSPFPTKWGGWIVPTLHPLQIALKVDSRVKQEVGSKYTYGSGRMSFVLDVTKCFTWPKLDPPAMEVNTSYEADAALLWLEERLRVDAPLSFDIETLDQHIDLIGFASSPAEAYVFPMAQKSWGFSHYWKFQALLKQVLAKHPKLVGQNAAFDKAMLLRAGFQVAPLWFDTRVGQSWVYPDLPGDLHYMVSIYTTHPHYKWMIDEYRMLYNGLDCCLTYAVMNELQRRIQKLEAAK